MIQPEKIIKGFRVTEKAANLQVSNKYTFIVAEDNRKNKERKCDNAEGYINCKADLILFDLGYQYILFTGLFRLHFHCSLVFQLLFVVFFCKVFPFIF